MLTSDSAVDIDGTLDKEATSYDDIFDAFRLALKFYHFELIYTRSHRSLICSIECYFICRYGYKYW
jgi:hypothetical protein